MTDLLTQAKQYIPGGVNSPVRAFNGVGGEPIFFKAAKGAYLIDENGKQYIDYVGSWGPMIAGHNHPNIIAAISKQLQNGLSFGAPCALEVKMAQTINQLIPAIEMVRMVNSGTEATMSAIRLARGFTNRSLIIKFEGCYHGHYDGLLVKAGSGALTLGKPNSKGVPESITQNTICLMYNDTEQLEQTFMELGEQIAAVIIEPIAGNMNLIPATSEFLTTLRKLCDKYQSVLIFDEVMSGFRVQLGGATALYGIKPDLITLGKIIGGGMPVGAFGGKREIMQHLAPLGDVYQAGTLSGNPVAMAAGLATLTIIQEPDFYPNLIKYTSDLMIGMQNLAQEFNIPFTSKSIGGMFGFFFLGNEQKNELHNYADVTSCNIERFRQFFHLMLDKGIYFAPSAYEAGFTSSAHTAAELSITLDAAKYAFSKLN